MRHRDMQVAKLVDYALRFGIGAVIRRLGYLLECMGSRRKASWQNRGDL